MKTITENVNNEFIINKSKFITYLYKVNNELEVNNYLNELKNKYKDSTHICYSYIIGNIKRFNDDNEPNGTAGMPILNVLESNNLNNILCVVIRYFGGIKLGTGGLVRAYTKSVTECLNKTNLKEINDGYKIEIEFNYDNVKVIDILLKNEIILNKEFNDLIKYELIINKDNTELINKLEISCIHISIIDIIKY